jgi:DNA-binding transcriptional LysR family regulator
MIDPIAVMAFSKVAQAKSFTAAAQELRLSKGTISKLINKLESSLKTKLIHRTTRRFHLTETGQAFLEGANRLCEIIEEAESSVAQLEAEPRGLLKISAPTSFGSRYLAAAVADFLGHHPGISIDMVLNDRFIDLIEEGFDLAIRIGGLKDSTLIARKLAPMTLTVTASPTYIAASGMPRAPAELARHNCLIYTLSTTTASDRWTFVGPEGRKTVKVEGSLQANNAEVLLASAVAGLGILVAPDFIVAESLRTKKLVPVVPGYRISSAGAAIHVVYPPSRRLSPKLRAFVDFLAARFAQPSWRN